MTSCSQSIFGQPKLLFELVQNAWTSRMDTVKQRIPVLNPISSAECLLRTLCSTFRNSTGHVLVQVIGHAYFTCVTNYSIKYLLPWNQAIQTSFEDSFWQMKWWHKLSSFPVQAKGFSLLDRMSQHQVKFFRTMPEFHGNPAKNSLDILAWVIKVDWIIWHATQKVSFFSS